MKRFARALAFCLACGLATPAIVVRDAHAQFSERQFEQQADQQYRQLLEQARVKNALATPQNATLQRLRRIHERILPYTYAVNPLAKQWNWEVNLLRSDTVNAFCMPGGKIAFFNGIITKLNLTDDEIAIVMGHEITHALREHGVEQAKKGLLTQGALQVGGAVIGAWLGVDPNLTSMAARATGNLAQLHFSRSDEAEADAIGLELAARAGFDPRAGVALWQKMMRVSKGAPPQFLSSHPADANRVAAIQQRLPLVLPLYAQAIGKPVDQLPPYRTTQVAIVSAPGTSP
jgi:Zn-dependent protease with chaperone function